MVATDLKDTYCGKTVLVTGHTGFKGGWLALWLSQVGAKVVGYSAPPPTKPSFYEVVKLYNHLFRDEREDIVNGKELLRVISKYKPEFIFHLAAQPLVKQSYLDPVGTIKTNVIGTVNLLEAIRISKIKTTCVCVTSDKCYDNKEWMYAYRENDPMGGHDPYSASKGATELLISAYKRSFFDNETDGCELSSTRAGNVIGGGDWSPDRIMTDCVHHLHKGDPIKIRNPHAIRPWQFVLDVLRGYLLLAAKMEQCPGEYNGAWNFGPYPQNSIPVLYLVEKTILEWGAGEVIVEQEEKPVHEATHLNLDSTKAMTQLGWAPKYNIDETIKNTVKWYKSHYTLRPDMNYISIKQINDYIGG